MLASNKVVFYKMENLVQFKKMRLVIKTHTSAIAPTFAPHKFLLTQRPYASYIFYIMCFWYFDYSQN